MKYVVIDEFCGVDTYFDNFKEAKKYALDIQGVLYKLNTEDDSREFLLSYAD